MSHTVGALLLIGMRENGRVGREAAMEELATGEDESIPGEIADRLISGTEHPLKIWREFRGFTQETLGNAAGVGKSYISQIENTGKTASTKVLKALAQALGVEIDDLV